MTLFKYTAKDREGKVYERMVEAKDRLEIYNLIRQDGGAVVSIREASRLLPSFSFSIFGGIKTREKIIFAKNLGLMIKAGLPIVRALSVIGKQSKNKAFKKLLLNLEEDVSHGKTLSEALAMRPKVFSTIFVSQVRAGEESGNVSLALIDISVQMEKSHELLKKVRGAMIYPSIVIIVMIVLAVLLLMFMVPTLTATFEGIGAKLPLSTRTMIYLSGFLVGNPLLVINSFFLAVLLAILFARTRSGKNMLDKLLLTLPIIGEMIKEFESARTSRILSSLLASGVEIVVAIEAASEVAQNHLYKSALDRVKLAVEKGEPISRVFNEYERLYPSFVGEMVLVGEETGKIADMLANVADYYEEVVGQKTKNLSTIIEPVLMIIVGAGVGLFAISMLAPTYSLVDYI